MNVYEQPYFMCMQKLLLILNDLNIMVTIMYIFLVY